MVKHIEITVGDLPEWYDEEDHDWQLEEYLKQDVARFWPTASLDISFNYHGEHVLEAWNEQNDCLMRVPIALHSVFDRVK